MANARYCILKSILRWFQAPDHELVGNRKAPDRSVTANISNCFAAQATPPHNLRTPFHILIAEITRIKELPEVVVLAIGIGKRATWLTLK